MKMQVPSLDLCSRLRILNCRELWCRLAAIAPIPPLGTSICCGRGPIKKKKKKRVWELGKSRENTLIFVSFQGCTHTIWRFPGQGSNQSCSSQPTPQPQQCWIRAASATYTTAYDNAGSLTHCLRPGIKPASSWILVRFVSTEPRWELLILHYILIPHTFLLLLTLLLPFFGD